MKKTNDISAVILVKNEAQNIRDCISSVKFCNEIVVIDDQSSDDSVKIAKSMGAKVYSRNIDKDYAGQSNFGMDKAKGKWVLFIDADERISLKLKNEIIEKIYNEQNITGYYLKRIDYIWDKAIKYGEVGQYNSLRLVRKGSGKWFRRVHSVFINNGNTSYLKNRLYHYPHPNLYDFVNSINRWSTWHAISNNEEGKRANLIKIVLFPILKFIKGYVIMLGFADGIRGFVVAMMMSLHSFLAWSKLWLIQIKLIED